MRFPSERVEAWARFDTFFEEEHERLFKALYFVTGNKPGEHDLLWILDVDGVRLVLDVSYSPGASAKDRAELLQIVESIRIDPR